VKSGNLKFEELRQIEPWNWFDRYTVRASAGALDTWVEVFSVPPRGRVIHDRYQRMLQTGGSSG
jgi:hypothetical protein